VKSFLHLFLWGGAYFIGAKPIPLGWLLENQIVFEAITQLIEEDEKPKKKRG
jgi:hypothetical protein